jgi:hypothetical protein
VNHGSLNHVLNLLSQAIKEHRRVVYGTDAGPIMHAPAPPATLDAFAKRHLDFPNSYLEFLLLHDGVEDYKDGFTLIGVTEDHSTAALDDIRSTLEIFLEDWSAVFGEPSPSRIAEYESTGGGVNLLEAGGKVYVANKPIFGTNFNGELLLFRQDAEVIRWSTDFGILETNPSLLAMFQKHLEQLSHEIEQYRGVETGGEANV